MKRKGKHGFPKALLFLLILTEVISAGCTHQVILEDNKVVVAGLYEVNIPSDEWVQLTSTGGSYGPGFSLTGYIMSFRCPGEQMIGISKALYQHKPEKGRKFFPSTEEFARFFFEDYNENSGFTIQEILSTRTFQLAEHSATEFEYSVIGLSRLCTEPRVGKNVARSRVIILKEGQSLNPFTFGQLKYIVFVFRSSPEMFDQSVPEFERMVQSFKFVD